MKLSNKILIALFCLVIISTFFVMVKIKAIQEDFKQTQTIGNKSWITQDFPVQDFTQLQIGHYFEVNWHKGDPKVTVKIEDNLKSYVIVDQESQQLRIHFDSSVSYETNGKIMVDVYSQTLSHIKLEDFVRFTSVDTLTYSNLKLELEDHCRADFIVMTDTLNINLYDFSKADLRGSVNIANIILNDHTKLDAENFHINRAIVDMHDFTKANLQVKYYLKAQCLDHSKLEYKGDSVIAEIQQRDFSRVNKED